MPKRKRGIINKKDQTKMRYARRIGGETFFLQGKEFNRLTARNQCDYLRSLGYKARFIEKDGVYYIYKGPKLHPKFRVKKRKK